MYITDTPLAERLRPKKLNEIVGQDHLVGLNGTLTQMIARDSIPSMIFWGPPGVGKTTLAQAVANSCKREFYTLSAINSGVKDVRHVIDQAKSGGMFTKHAPLLFIDEIHRFSKSQQDSLLGAVEKGIVILIGATTENPSFEVIPALLSRTQVYTLSPLNIEQLNALILKALKEDEILKNIKIEVKESDYLIRVSGGDVRKLFNALELLVNSIEAKEKVIDNKLAERILQKKLALYDKSGENHYDIASALIKSIRGSDPNAAVYWLARMLEGGEDPKFIARRLLISASEDVGLANPGALNLATNAFTAVEKIGMPESRIILSQLAVYLAVSPKSNATYMAIKNASKSIGDSGDLPVPLHLRNAPTALMEKLDYGKGYQYAHDFENNFVALEYLPDELKGTTFYQPGNSKTEIDIRKRLLSFWKEKYQYED